MNDEIIKHEELPLLQIVDEIATLSSTETGLKVLTAKSLGLNPYEAITGINIIQGKPTMSSALQNKILRREGWDLDIKKDIDKKQVIIIGINKRLEQKHEVIKSYEWAKMQPFFKDKTGNVKGLWSTDPLTMLTWRAISEFYRLYSESPAYYETTELKEAINDEFVNNETDELQPIVIK